MTRISNPANGRIFSLREHIVGVTTIIDHHGHGHIKACANVDNSELTMHESSVLGIVSLYR
jgi:hypothetical protein